MKKLMTVLLALLMLMTVSACSNTKKEEDTPVEPVPAETAAIPEAVLGNYHEQIAGRGALTLADDKIVIDWGSSASQSEHYEFNVVYDAEKNALTYTNGAHITIVFESETKSNESTVYNDGTGYFEIGDNTLTWHDDKGENDNSVFVKDGSEATAISGVPNPWTYTDSLEEAVQGSGIKFEPPVGLPEGFELVNYGYTTDGIIEANYEDETRKLTIRKSDTYEGQELSGDHNDYSKNWQHSLKGLTVDCYGDGELINLVYCGIGDDVHYSINVVDKEYQVVEGNGITIDDINSIVNTMQ